MVERPKTPAPMMRIEGGGGGDGGGMVDSGEFEDRVRHSPA